MNWFLQNFSHRIRFAFQNPGYTFRSLYREVTLADERFLASVAKSQPRDLRSFLNEPARTESFSKSLKQAETDFRDLEIESADLYAKKVLLQYAAVRAFRPDIVVETGVANGVSSAYLLLALELNNRGTLYSIGLDDARFLPPGKSLGWVVPVDLRSRWKLVLGDARDALPKLLADLKPIDVFIHDSLHTYEHMLWEYRTAYPYLKSGGLLISDDASWNPAFPEFSREVVANQAQIIRGVGFLSKA